MKLLICFCVLISAWPCLSDSLPKRYCGSSQKEEIQHCVKASSHDEFEKMNKIGKECVKEHLPHLDEIEEDYSNVCEELHNHKEEGESYEKCFDERIEEHEHIKDTIHKCMEEHNA